MSINTKPRKERRPPDGKIRQSQVITTFGPGGMVDLLEQAVVVGGLDFWRYKNRRAYAIEEPRLRDAILSRFERAEHPLSLHASDYFLAPPEGSDKEPSQQHGIQCLEFPAWFVCQGCLALQHAKDLERRKGRYVHACTRAKTGDCVPVRFAAACTRGHLSEFPWKYFVHATHRAGECAGAELQLLEGASGDFSELLAVCACGARRPLSDARVKGILPTCHGDRPWLGDDGHEDCLEPLELLVRTASNSYFSQVVGALSIPDPSRELEERVRRPEVWNYVKVADDAAELKYFRKKFDDVRFALEGFDDDYVLAGVRAILENKRPPRDELRTAELKQMLAQADEKEGELPPPQVDFFASRAAREANLPSQLGSVVLAKKLREVRTQVGFSRFTSVMPNLQGEYEGAERMAPLGLHADWLPASEIRGEGILLCLDEQALREWEDRPEVMERAKLLHAGIRAELGDKAQPIPVARFYLLHSLAHLLINAIALHCGCCAYSRTPGVMCSWAATALTMARTSSHRSMP